MSRTTINGYHAHLYYSLDELNKAKEIAQKAEQLFNVKIGRFHEKPIGPHPIPSCQLAFDNNSFKDIIPWLMLNHQGLTIFIHPQTGDDLKDHSLSAMWIGQQVDLNLDIFK